MSTLRAGPFPVALLCFSIYVCLCAHVPEGNQQHSSDLAELDSESSALRPRQHEAMKILGSAKVPQKFVLPLPPFVPLLSFCKPLISTNTLRHQASTYRLAVSQAVPGCSATIYLLFFFFFQIDTGEHEARFN